ncbi:MAG: signal recognition particle-docking protein FtsY [Candidatus Micrarchaeota archaeon]
MFDFLKKKITNFVDKIVGKEETKEQKLAELPVETKQPAATVSELPVELIVEPKVEQKVEKIIEPRVETPKEIHIEKHEVVKEKIRELAKVTPKPVYEKPKEVVHKHVEHITPRVEQHVSLPEIKVVAKEEKSFAPQVSLFKKITGIFTHDVELSESELGTVFDDLELSLLESDASLETSQFMVADLRKRIVGKKVPKSKLNEFVNQTIRDSLTEIFSISTPSKSFFALIEGHRASGEPFVIMFVGPNGAGKTTTIAKIAHLLKQRGVSSVISASDTFRAAAIQQSEHHGEKIGVKVIKHDYGADPAAVAFDAVSHAKSKKIDVVLIDTAGRQETNANLISEMKKIVKVVKPHLKIFVGETLAGHSVIEQAKKFNEAIELDGLILTKLDCDAKGGNALSIAHDLRIPIYFIGLGQEYNELVEFTPQVLVNRILAS